MDAPCFGLAQAGYRHGHGRRKQIRSRQIRGQEELAARGVEREPPRIARRGRLVVRNALPVRELHRLGERPDPEQRLLLPALDAGDGQPGQPARVGQDRLVIGTQRRPEEAAVAIQAEACRLARLDRRRGCRASTGTRQRGVLEPFVDRFGAGVDGEPVGGRRGRAQLAHCGDEHRPVRGLHRQSHLRGPRSPLPARRRDHVVPKREPRLAIEPHLYQVLREERAPRAQEVQVLEQ